MNEQALIAQVRIGTAFNDDIAEEVHYVLDDHLASSTTRLNNSGGVIDRQEFYPFGDASLRTYSKKRYQFIGREKDAESGLHYWSARYYSSWMCRFISVDKMASFYAHLSPYNYADNDPINDFDIDGNQNNNTQQTPSSGGGSGGGDKKSKNSSLKNEGQNSNSVMHGNDSSEILNQFDVEGMSIDLEPLDPMEKIPEETFNALKSELQEKLPKLPLEETTMHTVEAVDNEMVEYEPQEQTKEEKKSFFNTVYSVVSATVQKAGELLEKGGKQLARAAKFVGNVAKGFGLAGVAISFVQSGYDLYRRGVNRETITKGVIGVGIAALSISFPILGILAIGYAYADDKGYVDKWIHEAWKLFDKAVDGMEKIYDETSKGLYNIEQGLNNGWRPTR